MVPTSGTIVYMATSERRPRIPTDLAKRIDKLRDDYPFEGYVRHVLERHTDFHLGDETTRDRVSVTGEVVHEYTDQHGGNYVIGRPPEEDRKAGDGAVAVIYMHDEEMDDPITARISEGELRALRDLATDLLNDWGYSPEGETR